MKPSKIKKPKKQKRSGNPIKKQYRILSGNNKKINKNFLPEDDLE